MSDNVLFDLVFGDTDSEAAVDHVFTVLSATYGRAWGLALGDAPISDVRAVWDFHLSEFTHSQKAKHSILWALRNLPDFSPTPIAFRNLCRQAPAAPEARALPEPKADIARVALELGKLGAVRNAEFTGVKDWAIRLRDKHQAGERLSLNQIRCYTAALA